MSVRAPNSEQKKAIEHSGGVLLSAGAGSGKTFVLIEHIIYLLKDFIAREKGHTKEEFAKKIRSYLSQIVLMTFTKKAAGELSLRLHARIQLEQDEADDANTDLWLDISEALSHMTVSTIHGFCYKILKQGFFPSFDPGQDIISEIEAKERVDRLFLEWFEQASKETSFERSDKFNMIIANKRSLVRSLQVIFGDPSLRLMWHKFDLDEIATSSLEDHFQDYFRACGWEGRLSDLPTLSQFEEHSSKKWYQYLEGFYSLWRTKKISDRESYLAYLDFFQTFKGVRAPMAKLGLHSINEAMDTIKELRNFLQNYQDDYLAYFEHADGSFRDWALLFKEVVDFIEDNYTQIPGLTFSDLEYFVFRGLQDPEVGKRIRKSYSYLIVDEFQDTSEIQFEILETLVGKNYERLFCVGDMKQAIYGFRGGELGVFKNCMEKVPLNLSMTNNYRSLKNIIFFNNNLFENIFKKGFSFEGTDDQSVPVEYQTDPLEEREEKGNIRKIAISLSENEDKITPGEINFLEAQGLVEEIEKLKETGDICILYKNLTPAKYLIIEMMRREISFSAQIKVPIGEDPVIGILYLLLENSLHDKESPKGNLDYAVFLLQGYCQFLDLNFEGDLKEIISQFYEDLLTIGLIEAYQKILFAFGVANSNYGQNMSLISSLASFSDDDCEEALKGLKDNLDNKYSIDFQYGDNPEKVIIMTAHASKGLEFDHILLGGIHSNGRRMPNLSYFGKLPGSYRWKASLGQTSPFRSPLFILEELMNKKKDFAESKRLFYVACTRAKKSLTWVDLQLEQKSLSTSGDSWINGIRSWEEELPKSSLDILEHIKEGMTEKQGERVESVEELSLLSNSPPFFHEDSLGIASKEQSLLGMSSELSVTRLASIVECPRKFYLQNICKFKEDDFSSSLLDEADSSKRLREEKSIERENSEDQFQKMRSSANRGTMIHETISYALKRNHIPPKDFTLEASKKDLKAVQWTLEKLKALFPEGEFISEEPLKFSFFGHMISGTPDLVVKDSTIVEIWDFKTGNSGGKRKESYWFQLYAYGMAAYELGLVDKNDEVSFVLAYVDEKNLIKESTTYHQLRERLYAEWKKTAYLNQVNQDHCGQCAFKTLCH